MTMSEFNTGDRVYVRYPDHPRGSHGYVVLRDPQKHTTQFNGKYKASVHVMVDFHPGSRNHLGGYSTPREYITLSPDLCPEQIACELCKNERAASPGRLGTDDEFTRARDILADGLGWSGEGPEVDAFDLFERVVRACRQSPVDITLAEALDTTEGEPLEVVRTWWGGM